MNSLKNLRRTLSQILRYNPAVRPKLPPPRPIPSPRCYRTSPRRPESLQPSRGPSGRVIKPAKNPEPAPALPRWYSWSWGSFFRNPLRGGQKWYQNQRIVFAAVATTGGVVLTLCFGTFETVPYSNRTHFIIVTPNWERNRGESEFNKMKKELEKKILPPNHPDSIRVKGLVTEIVSAAHRGLARRCHENLYVGDASYGGISAGQDTKADDAVRRGKEVLDDKSVSVPKSRNRWKAEGAPLQTKHLDGLKWEVIVVKEKGVNAMCLPGGKIIVFTGLLDKFKTDAEVATVLGHEVGHVIARHIAENITKNIWVAILQCFILIFCDASARDVDKITSLLLRLPFSRRMELEADHIGILLLGAAGFDPHIAPSVYEKFGKIGGDLGFSDFISTHPSSSKRARLLSEHMVMQEAVELYVEASAGKESKGFF